MNNIIHAISRHRSSMKAGSIRDRRKNGLTSSDDCVVTISSKIPLKEMHSKEARFKEDTEFEGDMCSTSAFDEDAVADDTLLNNHKENNKHISKIDLESAQGSSKVNEVILPRAVDKYGDHRIDKYGLSARHQYDWFTFFIDTSWRHLLGAFFMSFSGTWTIFAIIYYILAIVHDDLLWTSDGKNGTDKLPCITNVNSFISAFLFSMESQHTIGYGFRYVTDECSSAVFIVGFQCITGVIITTLLGGMTVAKLLRPKRRSRRIKFSRHACITRDDGRLVFQFRVADVTDTPIVESHVRLYMLKNQTNREGHRERLRCTDMNVGFDDGLDRVLMLWPVTVVHHVRRSSVLYPFCTSPNSLTSASFEIVAVLEGIVEATGMTFQARTSFLPSEILWGYRFVDVVSLNSSTNRYTIKYDEFDAVTPESVDLRRRISTAYSTSHCDDDDEVEDSDDE